MAGSASALNFEGFCFFIINSFVQACVTFTGQNYAARHYDRCRKIFRICMGFSCVLTFLLCMIFVLLRTHVLRMFSTDPEVLYYAELRLVHVCTFQVLGNTYEISGASMRGMGHSMLPTVLTLFGTCLLRLIYVATVFAANRDFLVLMSVYPFSWAVTGVIVLFAYWRLTRRLLPKEA